MIPNRIIDFHQNNTTPIKDSAIITGETLNQENAANNNLISLTINGKTSELGIGAKSPVNPYILQSVSNFDVISANGLGVISSVNFPYTLRSLPNGIKDYIVVDDVAKTAKLVRNIGEKVFVGTEAWSYWGATYNSPTGIAVYFVISEMKDKALSALSTHFLHTTITGTNARNNLTDTPAFGNGSGGATTVTFRVLHPDVNAWKAFLVAQNAAGTPVKIKYQLATASEIALAYNAIKQYSPQTIISTNSVIIPTLNGKFRILGT